MDEIKEIRITTDYITLGQFLKFASLIGNGAEAKFFLAENPAIVDGEEESRRGRKLRGGEIVEIGEKKFRITK